MQHTATHRSPQPVVDFHGAAIIDATGREVPITEDMVQSACQSLEKSWFYPVSGISSRRPSPQAH